MSIEKREMMCYNYIMKKVFKYIGLVCLCLVIISFPFCAVLANVNYKTNSEYWNELNYKGIVYNQHNYEEMKYGLGDIAKNGCGAIAVYNILVLENKYKPLPEIIRYFDNSNEIVFGILGTNPFSIMNYMNAIGYKARAHFNVNSFKEEAINSKYSILVYFNFNGGHYQLIYDYNESEDTFHFINSTIKMPIEHILNNTNDCFRVLITIN